MNALTLMEIESRLRAVADKLATVESSPAIVHLTIDISSYETGLAEAERIAVVDAIATAFGLKAAPTKVSAFWEHQAAQHDHGFYLSVLTGINGPRVCACGAACTHVGAAT